jgi:two-component system NtrC family sensor kinase
MIVDPAEDPSGLDREARMHKQLRERLLHFSRGFSSSFSLAGALEPLTPEIRDILGAKSVEIWLHQRRSRLLTLAGSASGHPVGERVPVSDTAHYATDGLRLDRPELRGRVALAPLRGWRRALGTLVIERDGGLDDRAFLDVVHEVSRQLSVGIENVLLLEDVLRQRRLLEDTFNSLIDLVAVVDDELRVVQTNEAFAARVGLASADLIGLPLQDLVGPETCAYVRTPESQEQSAPAQHRVEDAALRGTFLLTATPLSSQDGRTVGRVLVARDITRQTRLEAERAALRERLAQSEKLASLGQFVAGIAHEMNNPLQGVLGHLELLIDMTEAAKPVRRELKHIYQEADRAAKIVQNLLVFTGSHRMQRERVPVDRVLTRALASREPYLRRAGIKVDRRKGADLPPVSADPLLLQQALLNVLINAEHAIQDGGDGGRIDIASGPGEKDGTVRVTIRDTGPGLAEDVLPRIFDPFFTTKDVGQGTGLGLAIVYGIITEHGGTITAANAPDGGAVFQIELPAAVSDDKVTRRTRR